MPRGKGAAAVAAGPPVLEIPAITLERMTVRIKGETPLIVHRFGELARRGLEDKQQKKAKGAREARDPEAEFRDALYPLDDDGERFGFPGSGIKKCIVTAGGRFTTEHMTVLRGVVNVLGDLLEINGSAPEMRSDTVRLASGVSSIAYRPMFREWRIDVPTVFNSALIRAEQLVNLFQIGGFSVGLGDWRPERNGTFGTFSVESVAKQ